MICVALVVVALGLSALFAVSPVASIMSAFVVGLAGGYLIGLRA